MRDVTVLITCCNGIVSPGQIECLRVKERNVTVVGIDAVSDGYGSRLVDVFHQVPRADDSTYVDRVLEVCRIENVDVVLVANDAEFFLGEHKQKFEEIGTCLALNDQDVLVSADDKGTFLSALKEKGLPTPAFVNPTSLEEFEAACFELGYPQYPVVAKPRRAGGSRGVRIITDGLNPRDLLLGKLGNPQISLEEMKRALSEGADPFPSLIVMEYLPGREYSVDCLVKDGEALIVVPKTRDLSEPGRSVIATVELDPKVIDSVKSICQSFDLNYNVNVQLRYGRDGELYPYEMNPRIAATVAACRAAGANLLYYGVKVALGEEIPEVSLRNGMRMFRYYSEFYEYSGEND